VTFERSHLMHDVMAWIDSQSDVAARTAARQAIERYEEDLISCYVDITRLQQELERQKELHRAELKKLPKPQGITDDEWVVIAELRTVAPPSDQ
jgi:hypothetical protein